MIFLGRYSIQLKKKKGVGGAGVDKEMIEKEGI